MFLRAPVLREAVAPASAQLSALLRPPAQSSPGAERLLRHAPTPFLQVFYSRECRALCLTGPSLQDWCGSRGSSPQPNHPSLGYQDCHSCSTGPFLETKQGHRERCAWHCQAPQQSTHITQQVRAGRVLVLSAADRDADLAPCSSSVWSQLLNLFADYMVTPIS